MNLFEVTVSNSVNDQTQHVAGKFGTGTGTTFVPQVCPAGMLCVQNGLIPVEGYESIKTAADTPRILNGNTWYFNAATAGTSGLLGDHTGIYAFNNYDVAKATNGDLQYNIGAKTLGLSLPAGNFGDFCEIIIGKQYSFGDEQFSTAPTTGVTTGYATIAAGKLVYSASAPAAGSGVYFQIMRTKPINEGTRFAGTAYVLKALRAANA